ncbi:MAG: glycosyltransferase [Candidatus Omnitrophica bacterium]|nr:glycosyltransferase [Candidatus Omnitrophota bacterium]
MIKITLLSVNFGDWFWLQKNICLTRQLNQSVKFDWIIVDNNPGSEEDIPDFFKSPDIKLVRGAEPFLLADKGSYHHAAGIRIGLQYVKSRFLIIMDPDFYVVYPDWMNQVILHMQNRNLVFFGSQWHPRFVTHYHYFPSIHFWIFDLEKVDKDVLDFTPNIKNSGLKKIADFLKSKKVKGIYNLVMAGRYPDTGYKIFKKFSRNMKFKNECLKIVFDRNSLLKPILNKNEYFVDRGFVADLNCNTVSLGWEEFYFEGHPFGFHLRRVGRPGVFDPALEKELLNDILRKVISGNR